MGVVDGLRSGALGQESDPSDAKCIRLHRRRLCAFPRVINLNRLHIGAIHQKAHFLPVRTCTTARQSVFMSVGFRGIAHVISHSLHLLIGAARAELHAVSERRANYNELNPLAWPRMKPIQLDKSSCGFNASRCEK